MSARDVLKNLNLFVNGKGYAGQVEEYNPPKLTLKTEEFMAGGMFSPVELTMAMEKLECDFSLICEDADILRQFGVTEGNQTPVTVRGHLESFDGTTTGIVHNLRGKFKEIDRGTWQAGQKKVVKTAVALTYYKETRGGQVIHEVDPVNMVFVVDGVDLLATARANLGI